MVATSEIGKEYSLEELPPIEKIAFGEPIELPQEQPAAEEG